MWQVGAPALGHDMDPSCPLHSAGSRFDLALSCAMWIVSTAVNDDVLTNNLVFDLEFVATYWNKQWTYNLGNFDQFCLFVVEC